MSTAAAPPPPAAPATAKPWLARLPAPLLGMPLGLMGLSGAWNLLRPHGVESANAISNGLLSIGASLLVLLAVLWLAKWLRHPEALRAEWNHPVQGALLCLLPVSTLLAIALTVPRVPEWQGGALALALCALAFQAVIAWDKVGRLTTGQMPVEMLTPVLYLPTVAGGFVGAMALQTLGYHGFAVLLLGMGAGAWALIEARILHRLYSGPLPPPLRPTLGIEMAPGAVGTLAMAVLWPELSAEALLLALGVASGPVLAVLTRWRWWTDVPFSAGFWSFSFPVAAMGGATAEIVRRGGWPHEVAWIAVGIATLVIAFLAVRTLLLLLQGKLIPPG